MKKLVLLISIGMLFLSCQKGEDDPLISFKSRKNRLSADWVVSSYMFQFGDSSSVLRNDSLINSVDSVYSTYAFSWEIDFSNDGQFTSIKEELYVDELITTTETGNWEFTGSNNEAAKSQLLLMPTQTQVQRSSEGNTITVNTTSTPIQAEVYHIKELRTDKVVLEQYTIFSDPFTSDTLSLSVELTPNTIN